MTFASSLLVDPLVRPFWQASTVGAHDDYFTMNKAADWTAVAVTGTPAWSYQYRNRVNQSRGIHSRVAGSSANDYPSYVKALPGITTGDYIQAAITSQRTYSGGTVAGFGIVMTDGVTDTSNAVAITIGSDNNVAGVGWIRSGTLTNMGTGPAGIFLAQSSTAAGPTHFRIVYSASNTFQIHVSLNGEDFTQLGANVSLTMTPTHGGFAGAFLDAGYGLGHYFHSNVVP